MRTRATERESRGLFLSCLSNGPFIMPGLEQSRDILLTEAEGEEVKTQEELGTSLGWRPCPKDGAEDFFIHSANTEHPWQLRRCSGCRHPRLGGAAALLAHPLKERWTAHLAVHAAVCSSPPGQKPPRAHCAFSHGAPRGWVGDHSPAAPCPSS